MDVKKPLVAVFLVSIIAFSGMLFAQRVIDLDKVWGDMRVLGDEASDLSGFSVSSGDINGDGYHDIIIGAVWADAPGGFAAGEVYVIFGSSSPPSTIDLDKVPADITVYGVGKQAWTGRSVASGDVNNDGYDDVIIGAPQAGQEIGEWTGKVYVIFGSSSPPSTIDLKQKSADITICTDWMEMGGWSVASGDINGDGYDDIILGAEMASPTFERSFAGATYIIFGGTFTPPVLIDLDTQSADITIYGDYLGDNCGHAVASGNVNGDGFGDLIIGAYGAGPGDPARDDAGETYVIFGSSFASPPYTIDLDTQPADITICGDNDNDRSGWALASGDINGDGYDDVIIGAYLADPPGGSSAGKTYVIFGCSSLPSTIDLDQVSADIMVCGDDEWDFSGMSVASGNINGDGYDDVIIYSLCYSCPSYLTKTYVVFGKSFTSPVVIDLDTQPADITVCISQVDYVGGFEVASGDINSDGYYDLIIGDCWADVPGGADAGQTCLILGGGAIITAHGLGGKSWIKQFSLLGRDWGSFKAFGAVNSQGEVHLAIGDVDADSRDEIAAGQGEGGKSWVKFFEVDGSLISTFKAFGAANTNGELHLTIGNFDADTSDNEIAIAQGEGGQSWVKLFETDGTFIRSIKAFGAANAQGEVHVAAGDLENADGIDEIVAGMGEGGSSRVKIFNYDGTVIRSFQAFEAADNPGGDVHLAVGNFDADADLEIAAATGYNGGNKVRLFDKDGTLIKQFLAFGFGGNANGDVQITAADIDNDGIDEIICGHGEGGSSMVKVFKADGTSILNFKAFGGVNAQGEVHLGKSNY